MSNLNHSGLPDKFSLGPAATPPAFLFFTQIITPDKAKMIAFHIYIFFVSPGQPTIKKQSSIFLPIFKKWAQLGADVGPLRERDGSELPVLSYPT